MSVVNLSLATCSYTAQQVLDIPTIEVPQGVKILVSIAGLCNDAQFDDSPSLSSSRSSSSSMGEKDKEIEHEQGGERKINGDATDTGLLRFATRVQDTLSIAKAWTLVGAIPFNSKVYSLSLLPAECPNQSHSHCRINSPSNSSNPLPPLHLISLFPPRPLSTWDKTCYYLSKELPTSSWPAAPPISHLTALSTLSPLPSSTRLQLFNPPSHHKVNEYSSSRRKSLLHKRFLRGI